MYVLLLQRKRI